MSADHDGGAALARLRHELETPPFNAWMGLAPLSIDEAKREVLVGLPFRPEFSYAAGVTVFHGGVLAALIDATGYSAVAVWHEQPTPTSGLQIEYLAPAMNEELQARGMVRRVGRLLARVDVEVWAGEKLVALGRGTFVVGPAKTS
jgi:uncharacterized protein (TIGR00369 family)